MKRLEIPLDFRNWQENEANFINITPKEKACKSKASKRMRIILLLTLTLCLSFAFTLPARASSIITGDVNEEYGENLYYNPNNYSNGLYFYELYAYLPFGNSARAVYYKFTTTTPIAFYWNDYDSILGRVTGYERYPSGGSASFTLIEVRSNNVEVINNPSTYAGVYLNIVEARDIAGRTFEELGNIFKTTAPIFSTKEEAIAFVHNNSGSPTNGPPGEYDPSIGVLRNLRRSILVYDKNGNRIATNGTVKDPAGLKSNFSWTRAHSFFDFYEVELWVNPILAESSSVGDFFNGLFKNDRNFKIRKSDELVHLKTVSYNDASLLVEHIPHDEIMSKLLENPDTSAWINSGGLLKNRTIETDLYFRITKDGRFGDWTRYGYLDIDFDNPDEDGWYGGTYGDGSVDYGSGANSGAGVNGGISGGGVGNNFTPMPNQPGYNSPYYVPSDPNDPGDGTYVPPNAPLPNVPSPPSGAPGSFADIIGWISYLFSSLQGFITQLAVFPT